ELPDPRLRPAETLADTPPDALDSIERTGEGEPPAPHGLATTVMREEIRSAATTQPRASVHHHGPRTCLTMRWCMMRTRVKPQPTTARRSVRLLRAPACPPSIPVLALHARSLPPRSRSQALARRDEAAGNARSCERQLSLAPQPVKPSESHEADADRAVGCRE